jgi:hypothetical protein
LLAVWQRKVRPTVRKLWWQCGHSFTELWFQSPVEGNLGDEIIRLWIMSQHWRCTKESWEPSRLIRPRHPCGQQSLRKVMTARLDAVSGLKIKKKQFL